MLDCSLVLPSYNFLQGKTSFIRRFVDKPIAGLKYVPTIGVDVIVYPMMYGETPVSKI